MSSSSPAIAARPALVPRVGPRAPAGEARPFVRMGAFAGLALYGAERWGTMLQPAPTARLLGLVAITLVLAAGGPLLAERSRVLAGLLAVVAAVGMLAVCGLPLEWIRHVRIAVSANAIGSGLSELPQLLVPYRGIEPGVRMVILLGAAVLLFDAGMMMAFAMSPAARTGLSPDSTGIGPGSMQTTGEDAGAGGSGDLRRAVAALPLIALAAVPLTLVPAHLPYLQGALVFALLAALVWGERLPRQGTGTGVIACAVAAAMAMLIAPALDAHQPWINYRSLAGAIGGSVTETFDWNQGYGPLNWPQNARDVLEVRASRGDYWKAVNLEIFDGRGWTANLSASGLAPSGIDAATRARWTRNVSVTIRAMKTSDLIGPGDLSSPTRTTANVSSGATPGRWVSSTPLGPGDSYSVQAYSPHPSPTQLARAGTKYPQDLIPSELAISLPGSDRLAYGGQPTVFFPAFGQPVSLGIPSSTGEDGTTLVQASPYAGAYALAQRLRSGAPTPYAYVENVKNYLQHGFTYNQNPAASPYPLEAFLFKTKLGYCQQFAGAMALLLRMGGVPARVAAGFTSGQYDPMAHRWLVTDFDAHAWVEAYFPGYGWVEFDPTPGSAPARTHTGLAPVLPTATAPQVKKGTLTPNTHGLNTPGTPVARTASHSGATGPDLLLLGLVVLMAATGIALLWFTRPLRRDDPEQLVAELERAFARTGRPLTPDVTLAEIERRMRGDPRAEAYVRALREARFAGARPLPVRSQRGALRASLRAGLGLSGALRALWALPPRRPRAPRLVGRRERQAAGLH